MRAWRMEGNQLFFSFRVFRLWSPGPGAQFLVVSQWMVMAQVDCLRGLIAIKREDRGVLGPGFAGSS